MDNHNDINKCILQVNWNILFIEIKQRRKGEKNILQLQILQKYHTDQMFLEQKNTKH